MLHYFYAALLSICSITGIVGCESTISDYELQEASQPLEGQLVGKNYSKRVEFVPREWRIDVDIGLLPIERTRNEENRAKLLENFRNALFNLEAAYPDVSLASMLQIANYSKQLAKAGKNDSAKQLLAEFKKRVPDDVIDKLLELYSRAALASLNVDPAASVDEYVYKSIALMAVTGRDESKEGVKNKIDIENIRMMSLQARNKLALSNDSLAVVEDLTDMTGVKGQSLSQMYRALNNFFLGNYDAAATVFLTADEYSDQNSDYYLYNKLHLYGVLGRINWPEARAFLKRVEERTESENLKKSWAFSIIHAINTEDFVSLIEDAKKLSDPDNTSVKAENLCEAYYYVGLDLYNRNQKDLAKLFFVLSKAQKVPYFMEYTTSELALANFFKDEEDGGDRQPQSESEKNKDNSDNKESIENNNQKTDDSNKSEQPSESN